MRCSALVSAVVSVLLALYQKCSSFAFESRIEVRDQSKSYAKIGCPGGGPFTSISECAIICEDEQCANAVKLALRIPECDALIRSPLGLGLPLQGQLVELVSYANVTTKSAESVCLQYGESLIGTSLHQRLQLYEKQKRSSKDLFLSGQGAMMFLHMRHAGGTTLCEMMRANSLRTPPENYMSSARNFMMYGGKYMGLNCNPGEVQAWFGTKEMQLEWHKNTKYRFYSNELHLSRPEDLPLETIVMFTQFRHPAGRLYAVYHDTKYDQELQEIFHSITTDGVDTNDCSRRMQQQYALHALELKNAKGGIVKEKHENVSNSMEECSYAKHPPTERLKPSHWIADDSSVNGFKNWLRRYQFNRDVAYISSMKGMEVPSTKNEISSSMWTSYMHSYHTAKISESHFIAALNIMEQFNFVALIEGTQAVMNDV
jgi:hypothetical protein